MDGFACNIALIASQAFYVYYQSGVPGAFSYYCFASSCKIAVSCVANRKTPPPDYQY
jgi:hypothetical protein